MKYTIELTTAEKQVICDVIRTVRGNSLGEHRLFENTTLFKFDEESTDYDAVYRKGIEDGNKIADKDLKEIQDSTYDIAYNTGINDLAHAMKVYFPLNSEERLKHFGINIATDNFAVNNPRRLIDMAKAYEEKKKAEIKVGDEVYLLDKNHPIVVTSVDDDNIVCLAESGKYSYYVGAQRNRLTKTGRHFDEVEQLLDKLKSKEK